MVCYVDGNRSIPSISGCGLFGGSCNGVRSDLIVYNEESDLFSGRVEWFEGKLKNPYVSAFNGVEDYIHKETGQTYKVYAFEPRKGSILGSDYLANNIDSTRDVIRQAMKAFEFLHSVNFVIEKTDTEDAYCFYQEGKTVSLKIYPYRCLYVPSGLVPASHTKQSDLCGFGSLLCRFFFGCFAAPLEVFNYNPWTNKPPMRCVPCFHSNERAYTIEVIDFLAKLASSSPECENPAEVLVIHPVTWDTPERLDFFRDTSDVISTLDRGDSVIHKLEWRSRPWFDEKFGRLWLQFPESVRNDLQAPTWNELHRHKKRAESAFQRLIGTKRTCEASIPKLIRGSSADFLRCVRNLLAHKLSTSKAKEVYFSYSDDHNLSEGFDLMISTKVPHLLINVYEVFMEEEEKRGPTYPTLRRYLGLRTRRHLDVTHKE